MLKIGDFSKLSRISIRMLRHYDELGLLVPKSIDQSSGYRYYGEEQLPTAGRIQALKEMGFSLAAIAELLSRYHDPHALAEFLKVKRAEVCAEQAELGRRLLLLETAIKRLRKDETAMNYNVTLKTIPQRSVASVRQVIPAYHQEQLLWNFLHEQTKHLKLQPADPCCTLAVFHDEGFKESDVDVEIQSAVKGSYPNTEHVVFKQVPAVEVASATYQGSYDEITAVYGAVANWVNDNGYEFDGPMFSIYHVSPAMTQNPEELVTEVCCPVKKRTKV